MTSAPAIGFDYSPSRWLQRAMALVAALAVLAALSCALPLWIRLALAIAVLLATWWTWRQLQVSAVVAAGWGAESDWTLHMTDNEDLAAELLSFRVLGVFVLLRLRTTERGVHALLLAPDNSDADIRRRLRMRLATVTPGEALPRL
ncbi:MAG TPA: protein YgfX [Rhodanobacter sp.]|nr:protein YgfX [Rhodanobacter sp.]